MDKSLARLCLVSSDHEKEADWDPFQTAVMCLLTHRAGVDLLSSGVAAAELTPISSSVQSMEMSTFTKQYMTCDLPRSQPGSMKNARSAVRCCDASGELTMRSQMCLLLNLKLKFSSKHSLKPNLQFFFFFFFLGWVCVFWGGWGGCFQ